MPVDPETRLESAFADIAALLLAPVARTPGEATAVIEALIDDVVEAFLAAAPAVVAGWVRVSAEPLEGSPWRRYGVTEVASPPLDASQLRLELCAAITPCWLALDSSTGRQIVAACLGKWPSRRGEVLFLVRLPADTEHIERQLAVLRSTLQVAGVLLRRAHDDRALDDLAALLAGSSADKETLSRMLDRVGVGMGADTARVYVTDRRKRRPGLAVLHKRAREGSAPPPTAITRSRPRTDWVVRHDDWLLVPEAQEGATDMLEVGLSGRHGWVRLPPDAGPPPVGVGGPGPICHLLVPMRTSTGLAGVLEVSRVAGTCFDPDLDPASLLRVAPYVASAGNRVVAHQRLEDEMEAVSRLAQRLEPDISLLAAYRVILQEIGEVAGANIVLLLLHDTARPGHFFFAEAWAAHPTDQEVATRLLWDFHADIGEETSDWQRGLEGRIARHIQAAPPRNLTQGTLRLLPSREGARPGAALWVVGPDDEASRPLPGGAVEYAVSESFLRYVATLLEGQVHAYGRTLVAELDRTGPDAGAQRILADAARLVKEATGSGAALVYGGPPRALKATHVYPELTQPVELAISQGSLAWKSTQDGAVRRVLDSSDPSDSRAGSADLPRLARLLGWGAVRSWIFCPLLYRGRCVGAIKVLTSENGRFLGPHEQTLARMVAERAASEVYKIHRAVLLEELNALASRLAGLPSTELVDKLLTEVSHWISRFVRPHLDLGIFARSGAFVLVQRSTAGVSSETMNAIATLSRRTGAIATRLSNASLRAEIPSATLPAHAPLGVLLPLRLTGQRRLAGHIVVLGGEEFSEEEIGTLTELAREVSVLLDGERVRHEWTLSAGQFRHAVLGPVQGIVSAARALAESAEEAGLDVTTLRGQVDLEAEAIRLWRENQRLYMGGPIQVRPTPNDMSALLERCVARFQSAFQARNITVRFAWNTRVPVRFSFDEHALDIVMSNLIDNAVKYTFRNREAEVGLRVVGELVRVWVEDIGHPVPERLREAIYHPGERMDWADPFRIISGQGLGLAMAHVLVEAHDGRLSHTSEREGGGTVPETTPYRVRFTVELPHHWSRRRRRV